MTDGAPAKDLFQVVEIEVNRHCNRRCSYCPQSYPWFRKPEELMDEDLFDCIVEELGEMDFAGRLSFHTYNEPLLHPRLDALVARARPLMPNAWFVLYTNGDFLGEDRYRALLDAGIDHFLVTRHSGRLLPTRPFQKQQLAGDFMISNRGGLMGPAEAGSLACHGPNEMLMIHQNGAVVLCHEDAAAQRVMGWAGRQSLRDIWLSEEFCRLRRLLMDGKRHAAGGQCATCDNRLHPLPDTAI